MIEDATCILRKPIRRFGVTVGTDSVICGQRVVEQYLRQGYAFDWQATDAARLREHRKDTPDHDAT